MASAVILDLDGTVWDSHPFYAAAIGGASAAERKRVLARLKAGASAAKLLKVAGVGAGELRVLCRRNGQLAFYPGVVETLGELSQRGTLMGVVTNLPDWVVQPMLACHGLADLMGSVVTWGRTSRRKPAPDPLLLCCTELGVTVDEDCWYVGDGEGDAKAALSAGLSFGWASWGYCAAPPAHGVELTGFAEVAGL